MKTKNPYEHRPDRKEYKPPVEKYRKDIGQFNRKIS